MRILKFLPVLVFLSACTSLETGVITEIVRVYITATPENTATSIPTFPPTPVPTTSPTPTPTAIPAAITGYPRGFQLLDPTPVYGAPCGLVDTFDFPLDPPDGEDARGGFGFGNFNDNYGKFHAGEDWGFTNASNLGQSVSSIGHGQVTYAAPNGWGLDGGTVVIRHVFPWGGYVLSFYGHLSPGSVTLRTGDCVQRGDKIGEIGKPRTPPHLHFEVRLHLPNSTGHGYWSIDPTQAGWLPPSRTIWETRMTASPGVLWMRSYTVGLTQALGIYQDALVLVQNNEISWIYPTTGALQWTQPISDTIRNVQYDAETDQIYLLDLGGNLTAYPLPGPPNAIWKARLNALSTASLLPFPGGGVLVADRYRASLVSQGGQTIWQVDDFASLISWVKYEDKLILSTTDTDSPLWTADPSGMNAWDIMINGLLVGSENRLYIYAHDGLYQLDIGNQTAEPLYALPNTNPNRGGLAILPNGDLLLLVDDGSDRRLLSINPGGSLIWERSIRALSKGEEHLITQGGRVYLFLSHTDSAGIQADLYAIDMESRSLTHIMTGGSRMSYTRGTWLLPINDDLFLVNIGGGPMVALDPLAAQDVITPP